MKDHTPVAAVRYRNQATQRVLAVLSAFIGRDQIHGVSALARALGMNKNMVHRALTTLAGEGYLTRDPGGRRYQLGYRVLELMNGDADEFDIGALCRPFLEQLHALTGESVYLSIIVGRSRVNIDGIEARGRRVAHNQRGRAVPLHCNRMSRVLLAYLSDAEIEDYIRLESPLDSYAAYFPETANETPASLWEDINRIRRNGHIIWRNPQRYSAAYATFPILDNAGRPHAIITIGGPLERFSMERAEALLPAMRATLEPLVQQCRLFPAGPVFLREG